MFLPNDPTNAQQAHPADLRSGRLMLDDKRRIPAPLIVELTNPVKDCSAGFYALSYDKPSAQCDR